MMSLLAVALGCACGWWALGTRLDMCRRLELIARADHEIRGAATGLLLAGDGRGSATAEARLRAGLGQLTAARETPGRRAAVGPAVGAAVDVGDVCAEALGGRRDVLLVRGAVRAVALADRARLAQAVANLVANADEHGGGLAGVTVRCGGDRVRVEVADRGGGLPCPLAALVAGARRRPGPQGAARGRGLAIASAAARACGGSLAAMPALDGSRLVIDLAAATEAAVPVVALRVAA